MGNTSPLLYYKLSILSYTHLLLPSRPPPPPSTLNFVYFCSVTDRIQSPTTAAKPWRLQKICRFHIDALAFTFYAVSIMTVLGPATVKMVVECGILEYWLWTEKQFLVTGALNPKARRSQAQRNKGFRRVPGNHLFKGQSIGHAQ